MFTTLAAIAADTSSTAGSATSAASGIFGGLVGYVLGAVAVMGMLGKAGLPRWGGFVPFYNAYLLVKMAGFNGWLFLLFIIPIVNLVFSIVVALRLAKAFGKSGVFGFFLMWLLSIIGYFWCSYDSSTYRHPVTGAPTPA